MTANEVADVIKLGLKKGYKENLLLIRSYTVFIDEVREYLLTVNVAQQLLIWNEPNSNKIRIEYPVLYFYNNAFLSYVLNVTDIFNMGIISRQSGHSPTEKRYQKIDLAITQTMEGEMGSEHERSIVGIELKGINKNEDDIIKDAERLANAMILQDTGVGKNSIEFCFCGFLKRLDDDEQMVTKADVPTLTQRETNNWTAICNKLNTSYNQLNFSIDFFDIVITPVEAVSQFHRQAESDYSEVANDTGLVLGGILKIERKVITGAAAAAQAQE